MRSNTTLKTHWPLTRSAEGGGLNYTPCAESHATESEADKGVFPLNLTALPATNPNSYIKATWQLEKQEKEKEFQLIRKGQWHPN